MNKLVCKCFYDAALNVHKFNCPIHDPVLSLKVEIATLETQLAEAKKDSERLRELEAYQAKMDALWEEYIEKRLPGFEALCEFVLDPANKGLLDKALEAAKGEANGATTQK